MRKNGRKEKVGVRNINFFTETIIEAGKGQVLGNGVDGNDDGINQDGLGIDEDFKRSGGKIDSGDSFSENLDAEAEGLGATTIHDFIIVITIREIREVLNVRCSGELAA